MKTDNRSIFCWPGGELKFPATSRDSRRAKVPAFDLYSGEITCLAGPSGSGKSCFLAAAVGLAPPEITLRGFTQDHPFWPLGNHTYIYVPQFPHFHRRPSIRTECLYQWGRVYDGMDEILRKDIMGRSASLSERLQELLPTFFPAEVAREGLEQFARTRICNLSGGQLKRFGLLLRLPFHADIIFLDEPDSGLDTETAKHILESIPKLYPGRPAPAVLMVSHSEAVRSLLATHVVQLECQPVHPASNENERTELGIPMSISQAPYLDSDGPTGDFSPVGSTRDFLHQIRLLLGTRSGLFACIVPAMVLFLVLKLSGVASPNNSWDVTDASKYLFFGTVATMWLNLQLASRAAMDSTLIVKEQFWWTSGLVNKTLSPIDREKLYAFYAGDLCWSHFGMTLTVAAVVALLGVMVFLVTSLLPNGGWMSVEDFHQFKWLSLPVLMAVYLVAGIYGGFLGYGTGMLFAALRLSPPRLLFWRIRPRLPDPAWLTFSIPLLTLLHIVYSPLFIFGTEYVNLGLEADAAGLFRLLPAANPCAFASGIAERYICNSEAGGALWDIGVFAIVIAAVMLVLAILICSFRVIRSPEVRTE